MAPRLGALWMLTRLSRAADDAPATRIGLGKLYLVRHAQSVDNIFPYQTFMGVTDPILTAIGEAQAQTTGVCLAQKAPPPDFVFASCLVRTQLTALAAYPNQTHIYVAPYINEDRWGQPILHPGDEPTSKDLQLAKVKALAGEDDAARDTFDWAMEPPTGSDWPATCGPANWNGFLEWLAGRPEVRARVNQSLLDGQTPRIAVVSHSRHMAYLLRACGLHVHPDNAEAFEAELPLMGDAATLAFTGFASFENPRVICAGGDPDGGIRAWWKICWSVLVVLCSVPFCVYFTLRRRRARKARGGPAQPLLD